MTNETSEASAREKLLLELILNYIEAVQAGQTPDQAQILSAHPELADELAEFFKNYHQIHHLAGGSWDKFVTCQNPRNQPARSIPKEKLPPHENLPTESELGQLGDFRLLRGIGRGGMGVVYEAEQISLRRRVALKVLPFAAAVDPRSLQRFRSEAEAAAHLHHSNIVPVFAVGQERGVHYYAMQYIEGQSLAALIDELKQQDDGSKKEQSGKTDHWEKGQTGKRPNEETTGWQHSGSSALPLPRSSMAATHVQVAQTTENTRQNRDFFRFVARLGKQAAEALEHAHVMGVVHRDIKPANLLLDGGNHLWITDFGLAQFTSQSALTMTGEMVCTLRYASPEQVQARRGVVDHRTDIYSLGATLYELVTLRPVFDGQYRQELLHQIVFDEVDAPRRYNRAIPPELEIILLKALAKNPADRYATAQEMADDFQRYLDHKPIMARRPSLAERVRKWMRRHPSFVAAAMLVLFFGVIGLAVSTAVVAREQAQTQAAYDRLAISNAQVAREQTQTKAAYDRERQRAEEAEQQFRLARRSADEMIQIAEEELIGHPHLHHFRKRLLESALAYYQEFIELRREDAETQEELAATRDRVKEILNDLAVLQGAGHLYLLKHLSVLDDLRLSEEQREDVAELLEEMDKQRHKTFRSFHRLDPNERQKRFIELAHSNDAAVSAILSSGELRRLQQIALQCQGPSAFRQPDIASALKLTTEQRRQIRAIEANMFFEKPDQPLPKPVPWGRHEQARQSALKQIQALLTAEQTKRWREMAGSPFVSSGPIFVGFGSPPGGFGPPGPKLHREDRGKGSSKRP